MSIFVPEVSRPTLSFRGLLEYEPVPEEGEIRLAKNRSWGGFERLSVKTDVPVTVCGLGPARVRPSG
ncbi:hypothetical protein CUJ84_pRLN3000381 (plasmid) [Rhizobium leguminosarum]|uniref:Uncharacterized protein n=1 Tax=Rhizobium leguminosarum TaxID=384 RepID=A0A2K9ZGX1_RHILE|nr:hypothetical protein CUJ84_pRLN3000381 [Rhizobium leguminosarum]